MISLIAIALCVYGVAERFSSSLVLYVVEQSLIQKAPSGADTAALHKRFHQYIGESSDKKTQMSKLLRISECLEKVQHLTIDQLDELIELKP
jgi:hypothetical protein